MTKPMPAGFTKNSNRIMKDTTGTVFTSLTPGMSRISTVSKSPAKAPKTMPKRSASKKPAVTWVKLPHTIRRNSLSFTIFKKVCATAFG